MGWEVVVEVEPITLSLSKPLGVTSARCLLLCYARRRGLGLSEILDRYEIIN